MIYHYHCYNLLSFVIVLIIMNRLNPLRPFIGRAISGRQLDQLLNGIPLLKFMDDNDIHYGMYYTDGLNVDVLSFVPSGECSEQSSIGGLYVTCLLDYYFHYNAYGSYARRVRIDDDTMVYIEKNKFKCNKIHLEEKNQKMIY